MFRNNLAIFAQKNKMASITDFDFKNKRVLIRVDFNVPFSKSTKTVNDNTRIKAAIPTLKYVLEKGGSVVLMSHLGRPKAGYDADLSLKNIIPELAKLLGQNVIFGGDDCIGTTAFEITKNLMPGEVVLLENLRFHNAETEGKLDFAEQLANHGDFYLNDAFGTAHRAHASTAIIAKFFNNKKAFGFLVENEIKAVDRLINGAKKPVVAIIGGAKVSSKITIIEKLLATVDHLIIGGGMTYTFVKSQGGSIGDSLVEDDYLETAKEVILKAKAQNVEIHLPIDSIVADAFSKDATVKTAPSNTIEDGWMGLDIGANSIEAFSKVIKDAKTILWNGPMGVFEIEAFSKGTISVAHAVVEATEKGAFSLVGGGDSVAAVNKFNLADRVSYVSTGGGAMLEYLEGKKLPGIAAILEK